MESYKNFLIANIVGAAEAISGLRLHLVLDNLKKPLGSHRGAPIIIGGLATGFLIYCGHRWLSSSSQSQSQSSSSSPASKTIAAPPPLTVDGVEKQLQDQD